MAQSLLWSVVNDNELRREWVQKASTRGRVVPSSEETTLEEDAEDTGELYSERVSATRVP